MDSLKDDQSHSSNDASSSSPGGSGGQYQYQYQFTNNYHTPGDQPHQHFFPPHLPGLPGLAAQPPLPGMHQHGYVAHRYDVSPAATCFANGYAQQPTLRSVNESSPGGSFIYRIAQHPAPRSDDGSPYAGKARLGSEASPSLVNKSSLVAQRVAQQGLPDSGSRESSPYSSQPPPLPPVPASFQESFVAQQVLQATSLHKSSPYSSQPPPLPPVAASFVAQQALPISVSGKSSSPYSSQPPPLPTVPAALAVSPNDVRQDSASAIVYQNSPYFSEAPNLDSGSGSSESASSSTNRPVPAKSAFMCFSQARGKEITESIGADGSSGGFVEAVAAEWRSLSKQEKSHWQTMEKNEKTRFTKEKQAYKGPLARKLRAKKNPLAPKRPMSAFLMYAQQRRRPLQKENPDMPNADISRLLGEIWRKTSPEEKRPFLEREEVERKIYKARMEAWKNDEKLARSMISHAASMAGRGKRDEGKKRNDDSFAREESCSNQGNEPAPRSKASYSRRGCMPTLVHTGSSTEEQADSPPIYHGHNYDGGHWAPTYNPQDFGHHVKYTYPRPHDEDYK